MNAVVERYGRNNPYAIILLLSVMTGFSALAGPVTVKPPVYDGGIRNPMKGFIPHLVEVQRPRSSQVMDYVTLVRHAIKWCDIENDVSDGTDKIKAYCDREWAGLAERNIKVIPRVYLQWSSPKWAKSDKGWWTCWPADMKTGDWESEQFKERVRGLVKKLGECWDNDPRVAWVQMAIMGAWGEHHAPGFTPEMEKVFGDAFTAAFRNKKVTVRRPEQFKDYVFGVNADCWNDRNHWWYDGTASAKKFHRLIMTKRRQMTCPIEGEIAYGYPPERQWFAGVTPNDTLSNPEVLERHIDSLRYFGCCALGWINKYRPTNDLIRAGASLTQKTWGYRYELDSVRYSASAMRGGVVDVEVNLHNTGCSPFYAKWPVVAALLDPGTRKAVHRWEFGTDIRSWIPGEDWHLTNNVYAVAAPQISFRGAFVVPTGLREGKYILALGVLDPAGMRPTLRFATGNYFNGGWNPIGYFTVGERVLGSPGLDDVKFDDPNADWSLRYEVKVGDVSR